MGEEFQCCLQGIVDLILLLGFEHLMVLVQFREDDRVPVVPRLVDVVEGP